MMLDSRRLGLLLSLASLMVLAACVANVKTSLSGAAAGALAERIQTIKVRTWAAGYGDATGNPDRHFGEVRQEITRMLQSKGYRVEFISDNPKNLIDIWSDTWSYELKPAGRVAFSPDSEALLFVGSDVESKVFETTHSKEEVVAVVRDYWGAEVGTVNRPVVTTTEETRYETSVWAHLYASDARGAPAVLAYSATVKRGGLRLTDATHDVLSAIPSKGRGGSRP